MYHYLKNSENYGKKNPGGRPKATTERERRAIRRKASNSCMTARQIAVEAGVHTNVRNVQRIIKGSKHLKRRKRQKKPPLTNRHKAEREGFRRATYSVEEKVEKSYFLRRETF